MLKHDIKIATKTLKHPRILYVFREKLKFNNNSAVLQSYFRNVYVWKSIREDFTKKKDTERRTDSVYRARERLYDIIEANNGQYPNPPIFLTLTFSDNISHLKVANAYFRAFVRKLNRYLDIKSRYVCVPEFQKRGAVHYHVLFFNLPFIHYTTIQELWGHGFSRIEKTRHIRNMSAYVAKYLSKDTFDKRLYGQRAFFSSRGLLRSQVIRDKLEIDENIKDYKLKNFETRHYCYVKNYTRNTSSIC